MGQSSYTMSKRPSGLSIKDIWKVLKLLNLKKKLHILCKSKIKSLKVNEEVASNKLLGIKYKFQDKKSTMEEAHAELAKVHY
jgi:hypothetical protein